MHALVPDQVNHLRCITGSTKDLNVSGPFHCGISIGDYTLELGRVLSKILNPGYILHPAWIVSLSLPSTNGPRTARYPGEEPPFCHLANYCQLANFPTTACAEAIQCQANVVRGLVAA